MTKYTTICAIAMMGDIIMHLFFQSIQGMPKRKTPNPNPKKGQMLYISRTAHVTAANTIIAVAPLADLAPMLLSILMGVSKILGW